VISLAIALLSWRDGDDYDADNMNASVALAPAGIALAGSLEFTLPGVVVIVLLTAAVGAIWYAVARPLAPYEDEDEELDARGDEWEGRDHRAAEQRVEPPVQASPRRSGLGDLVAEYRAGEQGEVDYAARMQPADGFGGPATGQFMSSDPYGAPGKPEYGMPAAQPKQEHAMPATGAMFPGAEVGASGGGGFGPAARPGPSPAPPGPMPPGSMPPGPMPPGSMPPGPMPPGPMPPGPMGPMPPGPMPAGPPGPAGPMQSGPMGPLPPGPLQSGPLPPGPLQSGPMQGSPMQGSPVRPSPGIYGLLTVFTRMDGSGDAFDKLAEETVEAVQRSEPDTLIFVCHGVKSAPLQRIVYELYRDEVGFTEHQRQPHMERFATERQALVLATNVIELTVNAAKVVPLPTTFR
jgi:quinol monooxygenase YgiN